MEYSNIGLEFADRHRTRCLDKCNNQHLQNSSWVEPGVILGNSVDKVRHHQFWELVKPIQCSRDLDCFRLHLRRRPRPEHPVGHCSRSNLDSDNSMRPRSFQSRRRHRYRRDLRLPLTLRDFHLRRHMGRC